MPRCFPKGIRPNDSLGRAWHYDLANEGSGSGGDQMANFSLSFCNVSIADPPILHEKIKVASC
ncbi:hypothetical protein BO85DRAFT_449996 [Aspergillus piperis CBS 112811]|uniref:Uncharacterized protein n=1 Tax=Aspergillus piperis CBS 112811 TaxID=1448313 RepID=A0A8G1R117_9EURO|nr:hypothetical protein BO85DRAFT_449996 [Aspergillus piperis CBS 112811]RAH57273.1 hypothetical protein BO85DRAFT_449996 [Aspergillus piperis CBS 112811]